MQTNEIFHYCSERRRSLRFRGPKIYDMKRKIFLGKRGSHVGVILSFVIFVTFLVFLYFLLEPSLVIQKDKQTLLDKLKIELIEKFSEDITTTTIEIEKVDITENCVRLRDLIGKQIGSYVISSRLIVKNESRDTLRDIRAHGNGRDLQIVRSSLSNVFFKIYDSREFEEIDSGNIPGCEDIREEYSIRSTTTGREIFETRINETRTEYETNYAGLKSELNIPGGSEFGFSFIDKEEIIIKTQEKNITTSVYAEEIPILYIDGEANINQGFLVIKVW